MEVAWEGGKKKIYTLKLKEGESRVIVVDLSNTKHSRRKGNRAKNNNNKQPEKKGFLSVRKKSVESGKHSVKVYFPSLSKYSGTKNVVIHKGKHIKLSFRDR